MKLFHYTDATAVREIADKGKMWLTDIRFLNDHAEYRDGVSVVRQVFRDSAATLPASDADSVQKKLEAFLSSTKESYTFIGSFTQGEDLLSQWRGYCPTAGGFALELEVADRKKLGLPMQKCVYTTPAKRKQAASLFELVKRHVVDGHRVPKLFQAVWSTVARFKNAGFSEEREYRVVIFQRPESENVRFRTRGSLIVPYLEVDFPWEKATGVWIGPCADPDLSRIGLERLMDRYAADPRKALPASLAVRMSRVTLRS